MRRVFVQNLEEIQSVQSELEEEEELLAKCIKRMKMEENEEVQHEVDKVFSSPKTSPMLQPENWELILMNLDPSDFFSAINTCLEWNDIMHTKKTEFLMPLVLPHVLKYLPLNTILNCRLVNKQGFKSIADTFIQQYSVDISKDFEMEPFWVTNINSIPLRWKIRTRYEFTVEGFEKLQQFLLKTEALWRSGGNPFISKYLEIKLGHQGVDFDNGASLALMLTRFGHHISCLYLSVDMALPQITISRISETLTLLPNLKILRLSATILDNELHFLNVERLPNLPHLESLDLVLFLRPRNSRAFPLALSFLHRYGRQLKAFSCTGVHLEDPAFVVETLDTLLPNLRCFKVAPVTPEAMMAIATVHWELEQLHLFSLKSRESRISLVDVVRVLNNFRETLKNLELIVTLSYFGEVSEERVDLEEMNILPKLKKITTAEENVIQPWFSDLLKRSCGNLEELHFQMRPGQPIRSEMVPLAKEFFGFLRRLKKIVFWANLQVILYR